MEGRGSESPQRERRRKKKIKIKVYFKSTCKKKKRTVLVATSWNKQQSVISAVCLSGSPSITVLVFWLRFEAARLLVESQFAAFIWCTLQRWLKGPALSSMRHSDVLDGNDAPASAPLSPPADLGFTFTVTKCQCRVFILKSALRFH